MLSWYSRRQKGSEGWSKMYFYVCDVIHECSPLVNEDCPAVANEKWLITLSRKCPSIPINQRRRSLQRKRILIFALFNSNVTLFLSILQHLKTRSLFSFLWSIYVWKKVFKHDTHAHWPCMVRITFRPLGFR